MRPLNSRLIRFDCGARSLTGQSLTSTSSNSSCVFAVVVRLPFRPFSASALLIFMFDLLVPVPIFKRSSSRRH